MARAHPLAVLASVSRLHIVVIAAMGTFTFGWLFTSHYPWALAAISAFDWFLVNLLNRAVDLREDRANEIVGTDFVQRHRRAILATGLSLLAGSLVATATVLPWLTAVRIGYHALGLAYNWPLSPRRRRLKQLYFWKNTASATGFMLTVFGYPLVAYQHLSFALPGGLTWTSIAMSGTFFFLFELSYEVIYDLRDSPGDRAAGVRTYPVVHGTQSAVRIIDALLVGSMAFLVLGYSTKTLPWRIFIMICAPLLQLGLYKRALRRGIRSSDCTLLTWLGAGLLAAYHLWILAGLPGTGQ